MAAHRRRGASIVGRRRHLLGAEARGPRPYNPVERWCGSMELPEGYEIIESVAVEMDPALDGFAGVLVELVFDGERYVLAETALGSGNRLLRFRSNDWRLAYTALRGRASARRHELCGVG